MGRVGIKELKNHLSRYLRRTKEGEEIVVTERGTPIAIIQPIQKVGSLATLEARLAQLASLGQLTLPSRSPLKRVRMARVSGAPISQAVMEDRR
jgi:prevent-host-death family protein